jgi:integrase
VVVHTNVHTLGAAESFNLFYYIAQCYNRGMKPRTIDDLFNKVWKKHWNTPRYVQSNHARVVMGNYLNHIKPEFGEQKLGKVTKTQVREWHERMINTPVGANRCLEVLSRCYKYAIDREWFDGLNPCMGIKPFTEKKRKRYATEDEIKKIGDILDNERANFPIEVAFLFTLLFTGARPISLQKARWRDLSNGVLTFEGKSSAETGEKESVIFPPNILAMIETLPKREDGLIFGIKLPGHFWRKIRKEAGCEDLWARDLRRTFATVGMSNNVKMDTIGELLNHHSTQTTKRYALLNNTARSEAVGTIASKLHTILKGEKVGGE